MVASGGIAALHGRRLMGQPFAGGSSLSMPAWLFGSYRFAQPGRVGHAGCCWRMPRQLAAVMHAPAHAQFVVLAADESCVAHATRSESGDSATRFCDVAHALGSNAVRHAPEIQARGHMPPLAMPLASSGWGYMPWPERWRIMPSQSARQRTARSNRPAGISAILSPSWPAHVGTPGRPSCQPAAGGLPLSLGGVQYPRML